ncbi:hypothetical protein [Corallococcus sp. AB045]|uniref:hypothetical protein n=1 Tax=Corallococcus sp. AB045 TaxID=2316719 RepID=UPI0011C36DA7|nr:hypothetical protein [Corallococcus sp. AB045]
MILKLGRLSTVLACLAGLVACEERAPEEGSGDFFAQKEAALDAGGVVELESNVLQGSVRLTNMNPQVLALLATDSWIHGSNSVSVSSTSPPGFSATTSSTVRVSPSEFRFEMQVEAGAGGNPGVVYNLSASRGTYAIPVMSGVTVRPVEVQPAPTEVTVQSCIGVVQFQFGTDATCQTLTAVRDVRLDGGLYLSDWGAGRYIHYVAGGTSQTASLAYSVSTSTGPVRSTYPVQLAAGCDEIVQACIPVGTPVPPALGGLTGAFEIHGETASSKSIYFGGPAQAHTLNLPGGWSPVNDAGSWWTSPNLTVGTYSTYARASLRSGRNFTQVNTPYYAFPVSVTEGPPMPLTRQVNGQTRHAYDMHPAYFYGSVHLADPFMRQHPGAWSSLQALYFEGDHDSNGDGVPDSTAIGSRGTYFHTTGSGGSSHTAFPGTFDANLGELVSTYEQVLPLTFDLLVLDWTQHKLALSFWSEPTGSGPFTTRPGLYDPARFRYGALALRSTIDGARSARLNPEQRLRINHEYCFNEVQIQYTSTTGRFFNPFADVSGSYTGRDWRNQPAAYVASGTAYGTPAVWNTPNPASYAQTSGQISMALPQGTFTLQPGAFMVSDSGAVNKASFAPIGVTLGCGQRLKLVPPLSVSLASLAGCAASDSKQVSGQVKSRPAQVDRVWYRLNGGPDVTLCTDCGFDPTFSFQVPLQACDNSIQVFAFTEGMSEPASAIEQLVWDDPADGPSCPGAFCVNQPPVARCKGIIVPANSACSGCGSVDDGSFDPDTGDTVNCVQTPGCPHALGSHTATLTCTDSKGLGSSCTASVTVRDTQPPTLTCPAPITVQGTGPEGALVTPGVATAEDSCAPPQVSGPAAGMYPVGTTPVTYTATDVGGNQVQCVSTIQVTEPPPDDTLNVTMCNLPRYTRETTLMACGWTTPRPGGAPVTQASFQVDGGAPIPVTPDLSGGFVLTFLNLGEGPHVVELTATDSSGAVTRKQLPVTVDLTPPVLAILAPRGDETLSSPLVTVTASVQDATPTRVTTQWLETTMLDSGTGTVSHTVDLVNRGSVPLLVRATDAAGNETQVVTQVHIGPAPGLTRLQESAGGPR